MKAIELFDVLADLQRALPVACQVILEMGPNYGELRISYRFRIDGQPFGIAHSFAKEELTCSRTDLLAWVKRETAARFKRLAGAEPS